MGNEAIDGEFKKNVQTVVGNKRKKKMKKLWMSRRKKSTFLFYKGRGSKKQEHPTESKLENLLEKNKV